MMSSSNVIELTGENVAAELDAALVELENAAIERAKAIATAEAQVLKERIASLEALVEKLHKAAAAARTSAAAAGIGTTAAGQTVKTGRVVPPVTRPPRQPQQAARQEPPPLPAKRTMETLKTYLKQLGFDLVSQRASGGGAWVFRDDSEFGKVAEHLRKNGIGVRRYPRGRRRYAGDHFEIDPLKVLPDR